MHPEDDADQRGNSTTTARVVPIEPGEPVALAVVSAISETLGCSPLELEPLSTQIDPDALDSLVHGPVDSRDQLTVSFSFAGFQVAVTRTQVLIRPRQDAT